MNTIRYFGSPSTVDGGERRAEVRHTQRGAQGEVTHTHTHTHAHTHTHTHTHTARNNEAESWPVNDKLVTRNSP